MVISVHRFTSGRAFSKEWWSGGGARTMMPMDGFVARTNIKWQKSRTLYKFKKCERVSQIIIVKQMMHVYKLLVTRSCGGGVVDVHCPYLVNIRHRLMSNTPRIQCMYGVKTIKPCVGMTWKTCTHGLKYEERCHSWVLWLKCFGPMSILIKEDR